MFKELGEFIDNVGRNVGFFAKKILLKNEPLKMGIIYEHIDDHSLNALYTRLLGEPLDDEQIDELVKQGVITKEEAEELKNVEIHSK